MKIYMHNGLEYYSTREAIENGQQFPGIFWAITPGNITGTNDQGKNDIFYPAFLSSFDFKGLPMGDPFEGLSLRNEKTGEIKDFGN